MKSTANEGGEGEPMRLRSPALSNEVPGGQEKRRIGKKTKQNIYTLSINITKYFFPSSSCYNSSSKWFSDFSAGGSEKQ